MNAPIRVAQVLGKMNGGGVEAVVMNYYRHIDRSKVQFDFLVDEDSSLIPYEEIETRGGRIFEIPPYQRLIAYRRTLMELLKSERWPIVHSHINALSVFPLSAAKAAGVPVRIAHSHSTAGKGEYAKNVVKSVLKTQANRYSTHRFACSKYAGEWLFGKNADFEVVHNAIELDRFSFNAEARARVRAELGLVGNQLAIGHVGRFVTQKNHTFLIDMFSEVSKIRRDAVLLLVGSGELKPFIESRVAERGLSDRVMFLGQRDDVDRLYQAFDAFVLPSFYEGLGLVGIEAQRAGLPCFLSDRIPKEADVTGSCKFLSVDIVSEWKKSLAAVLPGRRHGITASLFSDYDIDEAAIKLASKYVGLDGALYE